MPPKPHPTKSWVTPKNCKNCDAPVTKLYPHTVDRWGNRHFYPLCVPCFREMKNVQYAKKRASKLGAPRPVVETDLCEICGLRARLIDHCHRKGSWRGFLCYRCNTLLGQARDDVTVLEKAIAYLKKHQAEAL